MAHKKGQGSTRNGRDSNPQYLELKDLVVKKLTRRKYSCKTARNEISSRCKRKEGQ